MPLMFIAPRGLITILIFLEIAPADRIEIVTKPLVIQVIVLTGLVLMVGLIFNKNKKDEEEKRTDPELDIDKRVGITDQKQED
jgi:hypothetical protein